MSLNGNELYAFQDFRLDVGERLLLRKGDRVQLPEKAFATLCVLVRRSGQLVAKDELLAQVWPDTVVEENNLDKNISLLRRVLGEAKGKQKFIETVRGRGYRFVGDATRLMPDERSIPTSVSPSSISYKSAGARRPQQRAGNLATVVSLADWRDEPVAVKEPVVEDPPENLQKASWKTRSYWLLAITLAVVSIGALMWLRTSLGAENSLARKELTVLTLTSGEDVNFATISPDGKYFVYTSRDGENARLWTQQTGQSSRVEIAAPFAGTIFDMSYTPDSKFVYFIASLDPDPTQSLYRVPALGGVKTKIVDRADTAVSFSPDGREMVFRRYVQDKSESSLIIAASDGSRERVLLKYSGLNAISNGVAWSPDGKVIAYGAMNMAERESGCTIAGIKPETGEIVDLSADKWASCFRLVWTRDGAGIVFVGTRAEEGYSTRRDQLYYLSVHDGQSRRLTTEGNRHQFSSLGVTDADDILAVPFNRFSQIWAMDPDADSRSAIQITTGFADGRGGIAALPGDQTAYLTRNGDGFSIWRVNGDGSERMQLTTEPSQIEELRSAADGSFFVFSAKREGQTHLYRVNAAGEQLTQLTFGKGRELDSTVSPDGNWIVYDSTVFDGNYGRSALWKIPATGGDPVLLADTDCRTPHFSPDGRHVSCVANEGANILIISSENGETVRSLPTAANAILNIGSPWNPDGKAVTYMVRSNNVVNLWIHPLNDEGPRPLTDFSSGDIYNYAFSNNGTRLYLARGYQTRNAVLISGFR